MFDFLAIVLLSAEMRNPLGTIPSEIHEKTYFSCFQAPFSSPDSSPRAGSRPAKLHTTEVIVHCFCWKYLRKGMEVAWCRRCGKHFHVSCLSHDANVREFVCPSSVSSDVFPILVFTAWPASHLKTVGILLRCALLYIVCYCK
jgi:hypothetical protein